MLMSLIDCTENSNRDVIKFICMRYDRKNFALSRNGNACRVHGYAPNNVSKVSAYVAIQVD